MTRESAKASWTSAWPDALAFIVGLGVAWVNAWTVADLVWTLWLSSLVIGYSMILWQVIRHVVADVRRDRGLVRHIMTTRRSATGIAFAGTIAITGAMYLAFFTVHFGMFHFVHSQFLATFFPVVETTTTGSTSAGLETYLEVARRYWTFLPAAFLAERAAFGTAAAGDEDQPDRLMPAYGTISRGMGRHMMAPYRNVVRMHLLIFFFAFASQAGLDNFIVYAVVYAVYFFPWRLVRRERGEPVAASASPT